MIAADASGKEESGNCEHLASFLRSGCRPGPVTDGGVLAAIERAADFVNLTNGNSVRGPGIADSQLDILTPACLAAGCPSRRHGNIHMCLSCVYVSCRVENRLDDHVRASLHQLWFSFKYGAIFCAACNDYIFSGQINRVLDCSRMRVKKDWTRTSMQQTPTALDPHSDNDAPRLATDLPCPLAQQPKSHPQLHSLPSPETLPGLYNLGNTCYMNSVLQVLLHTPSLRNYFLSDLHRPFCPLQVQRKKEHTGPTPTGITPDCLACVIDELVSNVFAPITPCQFLVPQKVMETVWRQAETLATYAQHDAHEFLIVALNMIHTRCLDELTPSTPQVNNASMFPNTGNSPRLSSAMDVNPTDQELNPGSIIRSTFEGNVRSDVICGACKNSSPTFETFFDISLDLDGISEKKKNPAKGETPLPTPTETTSTGVDRQKSWESEPGVPSINANRCNQQSETTNSLAECLTRFTRLESLGPGNLMFCSQCNQRQESQKQLSLKSLPRVLCFHLKRFEHSRTRKHSQKLECAMEYPINGLNLGPYTASEILKRRRTANGSMTEKENIVSSGERELVPPPLYDLYAVVNHSGKIDRGHYTTQVRWQNRWFRCDDEKVTEEWITKDWESSRDAYLLFYVARHTT